MTQTTKEEQEYIENSFAQWHIREYLDTDRHGVYSVEDAIIKGMEDYIEELMEELVNLKGNGMDPNTHETQTQKDTQNIE
tara:strand:- start:209 stop:448 length:240 start_codon:yes stop_codon:yes gene_type:complete